MHAGRTACVSHLLVSRVRLKHGWVSGVSARARNGQSGCQNACRSQRRDRKKDKSQTVVTQLPNTQGIDVCAAKKAGHDVV